MSTAAEVGRCESCRGLVDAEDLFCANCGTAIPDREPAHLGRAAREAKNFACRGCGATMNYDAEAQSLKCPFCGSVDLVDQGTTGVLAPEFVIPFAIDRTQAEARLRNWMGSSFWHPDDLRHTASVTGMTAAYVPYWIFNTNVSTHWTADSSETPHGARADWFPVSGNHESRYDDLWVPAGSGLAARELDSIGPYDASGGVPPDQVDLDHVTVEQFSVSRRYARPLAQGRLEALEAQAVAGLVLGRSRNVHVNVLMEGAASRAALVPVFVLAYRYRDRVYRYVLNGQNGNATGSAPVSKAKIGTIAAFVVVVLLIILLVLITRN